MAANSKNTKRTVLYKNELGRFCLTDYDAAVGIQIIGYAQLTPDQAARMNETLSMSNSHHIRWSFTGFLK